MDGLSRFSLNVISGLKGKSKHDLGTWLVFECSDMLFHVSSGCQLE